jgi:DNA mismatch repair protein MutS
MQTASLEQPREMAASIPPRFRSILFDEAVGATNEMPEFFRDLNLDQIVDAITAGRDEYNLKPVFYTRLTDLAEIAYRHEIMRDLENDALFQGIKSFSNRMRSMRVSLAAVEKSYYKYEKEAWFLEAVGIYCEAVENLRRDLEQHNPESRGLRAFRAHLADYVASSAFEPLAEQARKLKSDLSAIRYNLLINGDSVTVREYKDEPDYSVVVEETFAKFVARADSHHGAPKDYRVKFPRYSGMDHIGAMILERVALLHPDVFAALDDYCARNTGYLDQTISDFDREIQFYVAWLEYAATFKRVGLKFCYPRVSDASKNERSRDSFDLALAGKLIGEHAPLVCNDFALTGSERILVVTGPNQGGKTTFSRTFGQLHYLASLGLPVAGAEAQLFLCDRLFTHFEREEDIANLRGKLEDDLIRVHHILEQATPNSVIIINEIFLSTTLKDAVELSRKVIERISELDALCVCVTFLDELSALNEKTVSLVAGIVPDNPTLRTYKIERRPADGLAYAHAIAEKYRLTYARLKERLKR